MANPNQASVQAIKLAAAKYGIDPAAMIAVGRAESGLNSGAVGDGGHAFGTFQLNNAGGVITGQKNPEKYLDPKLNAETAARMMSQIPGIKGLKGKAAVAALVTHFERPADIPGEIKRATGYLSGLATSPDTSVPATTSVTPSKTSSGLGNATDPDAAHIAQRKSQLPLIQSLMQRTGVHNPGLTMLADFQAKGLSTAGLTGAAPANAPGTDIPLTTGADPSNPNTPAVPGSTNPTDLAKSVAGPQAAKVVSLAQQYLGTPYKWGGADPKNGFDCSGFAQFLYKKNGVDIPRTTFEQVKSGEGVDRKSLKAGDLVFFNTSGQNSHEGIYIGNGKFIHAPHTGDVVKISNLNDAYYAKHFSTARRVTGGNSA